jgi:hypothetical protein
MEVDVSRSHLRTFGIALLALLAFPRTGSADLIDFIWEMSGPQMIGARLLHCEYDLPDGDPRCQFLGHEGQRHQVWRLTLDANAYTSTGKSSGTHHYGWGRNGMVAVEPMLEARSCCTDEGGFSVHHGVGLSYNFLFGQHFSRFNKLGVKITPIGITFKKFSAAYNVRVYPHGFTADEFGFGPRLFDLSRGRETLHGFSVDYDF